ncbi:MAG TPA: type IV secretion system DNA-binding domain-containing protein [Terriglobales bacterium]|nr:type IV secretion system DNA-binding domain-containing protein [Terriglobales bacterium]
MSVWPDQRVALFARTNFRNQRKVFGIRQVDRRSHMYLIGKTGTGKSSLIETLIRSDIGASQGVALLDPHGDLVEKIASTIPVRRHADLIYFDAANRDHPLGYNPLAEIPPAQRPLTASFLLDAFKKIWWEFWGPRTEHILRNALLALLDQPEATLADILRLFNDRGYRKAAMDRVHNAAVRDFWLREYDGYAARFRTEAIAPIQNKVGAFLSHPILRVILTQSQSAFHWRSVMDEGRIVLVNLAKGRLGEDAASLLGSLLLSGIQAAALSRADVPEDDRRDFFVFVDEFPTFATLSLAGMLTELRKFHVGLTLSHQHLTQLDPKIRDAILGNVGTLIVFRVGATDAEILEQEFAPEFASTDLVNLPNYHLYLKLMINGRISRPFSGELQPPVP